MVAYFDICGSKFKAFETLKEEPSYISFFFSYLHKNERHSKQTLKDSIKEAIKRHINVF